MSHLHYDHAGGMVDADGRPDFPNARYVVQRDEAEAAHGDELRLAGIMETEQLELVRAAGQLAEVTGEVELVRGVTVMPHRRPHTRLAGGARRASPSGGRAGDPASGRSSSAT